MRRLKHTALWILGVAFTFMIYTDVGLWMMALIVVPILVIVALKTPRVNDRGL